MEQSVQISVSYFNAQQRVLTVNGALKNQVHRMAQPVDVGQLCPQPFQGLCSGTIGHGCRGTGSACLSLVKADLVTAADRYPASQHQGQKLSAQYGTIPQEDQSPTWWQGDYSTLEKQGFFFIKNDSYFRHGFVIPSNSILPASLSKGL